MLVAAQQGTAARASFISGSKKAEPPATVRSIRGDSYQAGTGKAGEDNPFLPVRSLFESSTSSSTSRSVGAVRVRSFLRLFMGRSQFLLPAVCPSDPRMTLAILKDKLSAFFYDTELLMQFLSEVEGMESCPAVSSDAPDARRGSCGGLLYYLRLKLLPKSSGRAILPRASNSFESLIEFFWSEAMDRLRGDLALKLESCADKASALKEFMNLFMDIVSSTCDYATEYAERCNYSGVARAEQSSESNLCDGVVASLDSSNASVSKSVVAKADSSAVCNQAPNVSR
jgi:hypothetical protein